MFVRWAKNKVVKWFKKESNQKLLLDWGVPLILRALKAFAAKTSNTVDDRIVKELETWWNARK
jgi:hypothetical protein